MKSDNFNLMEKSYRKPLSPVDPPPCQVKKKTSPNCIRLIPEPPGWQSTPEQTWEVVAMKSNAKMKDAELKWKVFNRKVKKAILDAGASSSCGHPEVSECGKYRLNSEPFITNSHKSNKILQHAVRTIAAAEKIKPPFNIKEGAKDVHMIPGIQKNLSSTKQFSKAKYITIFDEE